MIKNDYKDFALVSTIPENWSIMPLKWFLVNHDGGAWGDEPTGEDGDRICIRIADFNYSKGTVKENTELTIRNYSQSVIDRLLLRKGDIIVEKSGGGDKTPVGRTIVFRQNYEALFANFSERLRIRSEYNYEFVNYCLRAFYYIGGSYNYFNQTTGIQNLSIGKYLSDIYLPCPDTSFQDAIVSYLDAKCAAIDEAIERHKKIIDKLEEYKKSAISGAIAATEGNIIRIKFIGSVQTGPFGTQLSASEYVDDGTPCINVKNIKNGYLSEEDLDKVPQNVLDRLPSHILRMGDIVFARKGSIDKHAIVHKKEDGWMQGSDCIRLRTQKVLPEYLNFALASNTVTHYLRIVATGSTMPSLTSDMIKELPIIIPTISVQKQVVDKLDNLTRFIDICVNRQIDLIAKLEEYRKSIIYNAVTGKIDCRTVR